MGFRLWYKCSSVRVISQTDSRHSWFGFLVHKFGDFACQLQRVRTPVRKITSTISNSFAQALDQKFVIVLMLIFFINFSKSDAILKYQSSMMFWVCIGLMIFYVGTLPFYGLRTTLYHLDKHFFYVYWNIQFVLNYLMYTLFAVAFIWGKPN